MIIYLILLAIHKITQTGSDSESELMKKIASRDIQALESLYDSYSGLMYSLIYSIVEDKSTTEELLQDVFIQIWEKAHLFDMSHGNVCQWIVTLARNRAIDKICSRDFKVNNILRPLIEDGDIATADEKKSALDATILKEKSNFTRDVLKGISSEQKEVIEKSYYQGLTQSEIAESLNIPLETVKTRLRLGMLELQTLLGEVA